MRADDRRWALWTGVATAILYAGLTLTLFPARLQFAKYPRAAEQYLAGTLSPERLLDFSPFYFYLHVVQGMILDGEVVVFVQILVVGATAALVFLLLREFFSLAVAATGTLTVAAEGLLTLFAHDVDADAGGATPAPGRELRVHVSVGDRPGWLAATSELELRRISADLVVPLDGSAPGTGTVTLHEARVFGRSWERLVLGAGSDDVPLLPEARVLLSAAVRRIATS